MGTELTPHASMELGVTFLSRRRGALVATTWAVMQYMDERFVARGPSSSAWLTSIHHRRGYHQSASITAATRKIAHNIRTGIPELSLLGNHLRPLSLSERRRVLESTF